MTAVRSAGGHGLELNSPRVSFAHPSFLDYSVPPRPATTAGHRSTRSMSSSDRSGKLAPPSATRSGVGSSITAPSPSTSEGTEFDDTDGSEDRSPAAQQADKQESLRSPVLKVETAVPPVVAMGLNGMMDEIPQSVIYAPEGYGDFTTSPDGPALPASQVTSRAPSTVPSMKSVESTRSDATIKGQKTNEELAVSENFYDRVSPTPLQTSIPPSNDWTKTPRAHTKGDLFSRPSSSLASITEDDSEIDRDRDTEPRESFRNQNHEINALNQALAECWTLCNTLASLSHSHRERMFSFNSGRGLEQQAWQTCWKLCQNLYEARTGEGTSNVRPTLDLCRDFCQALFETRSRGDEDADSVLRVSFELNNHLYNTHDRKLPSSFRERTLDFYVTLCHRLMRQREATSEDTDSLLRACWGLAEMLFSLRQSKRADEKPEEELLSAAVQACWDLCDLFRDSWTQGRPERQTPRAAQSTFSRAFQQATQAVPLTTDSNGNLKLQPETPTTLFEDTGDSPYEVPAPNIVVMDQTVPQPLYSSSASVTSAPTRRSTYKWPAVAKAAPERPEPVRHSSRESESSVQLTGAEGQAQTLLRALFVRAAVQTKRGFLPLASPSLSSSSSSSSATSLPTFVKSLPETAFGTQAWQTSLLAQYRSAVLGDSSFRRLGSAADPGLLGLRDMSQGQAALLRHDFALAVRTMIAGTAGWNWLQDLFRFVFGMQLESALQNSQTLRSVSRESTQMESYFPSRPSSVTGYHARDSYFPSRPSSTTGFSTKNFEVPSRPQSTSSYR